MMDLLSFNSLHGDLFDLSYKMKLHVDIKGCAKEQAPKSTVLYVLVRCWIRAVYSTGTVLYCTLRVLYVLVQVPVQVPVLVM
jgi:hypothetical protein